MSEFPKIHKHAPWSKKVLVSLWVLQLGLSIFQFAWPLLLINIATVAASDSGATSYDIAAWAVNMALGLILSTYTMLIIVKFAKFKLTSKEFQIQSIAAVAMGLLGLILDLAGKDFFGGITVGSETLVSIGICVYVVVIRRRVRKGMLEEMKRPGTRDVELEGGREEVPNLERRGSKDLAVVESTQWARKAPSFSSAVTGGEDGARQKEPREML